MTEETQKKARRIPKQPPRRVIVDIRAGILSKPKIAEKHKVSVGQVRQWAKMLGVDGDLRADVMVAARAGYMDTMLADNAQESIVVNENAQIVLALMRDHSDQVRRARNIATLLMDDLETAIRRRDEIENTIAEKCAEDKTREREARLLRAVSLPVNTKTLADLAGAMKTLIGLEREIFNIGKDRGDDDNGGTLEDYLLSLPGEATRVPG